MLRELWSILAPDRTHEANWPENLLQNPKWDPQKEPLGGDAADLRSWLKRSKDAKNRLKESSSSQEPHSNIGVKIQKLEMLIHRIENKLNEMGEKTQVTEDIQPQP